MGIDKCHATLYIRVQKFGQCDTLTATSCLLRCIYDTEVLSDGDAEAPISQHIKRASDRQQVCEQH